MRVLLFLIPVLSVALPVSAHADVEDPFESGYVATSGLFADEGHDHYGVALEGGPRLGRSVIFLHGLASAGYSTNSFSHGRYEAGRVGLEARDCTNGERLLCGFLGIDIGLVADSVHQDIGTDASMLGGVFVSRVGVEVGHRWRGRLVFEVPIYRRMAILESPMPTTVGAGIQLGVGYAF